MGESKSRSGNRIVAALELQVFKMRRMGVKRLGLFGSAARGEADPESDLDFLVELDRETFDSYMDVKEFLEDLFGRPVDLVMRDNIKPRLRPYIQKDVVYVEGL